MNLIKGLFFDLDGTLVDTLEADFKAYCYAIKQIDRTLNRKMYNSIIGLRVEVFLCKLYPGITNEEIDVVRDHKAKIYPTFLHLSKPNHQLINFLKTLRTDYVTVLVTTAREVNASSVLKASGLENLFDHVVTGDMVTHAKPNPEIYLKALKLSGLQANEILAFEDSRPGIEAALAAGINTLKVNTITKESI